MAPSLGKMAALETLTFEGVLNGEPDASLGELRSLKKFVTKGCKFNASFPSSWSNMVNLETFQISDAKTTPSIPFPTFLAGLPALKTVLLANINLLGAIPEYLGLLPSIESIALADIPSLTAPIPESITQSRTLKSFSLSSLSNFQAPIPSDWSNATSMTYMAFYGIPMTGSVPSRLPPKLSTFSATITFLSGSIPQTFIDSPDLQNVFMTESRLSGTIPSPTNPSASNLVFYFVSRSTVTDMHPDVLMCPKLQQINFSHNKLTGLLPPKLYYDQKGQSPLTSIFLHDNEFVGEIPNQYFDKMPNLTYLELQRNNLSGALPWSLANRTTWTSLDFSSNSFFGAIPDAGKWALNVNLTKIAMSNNYLSGSIPKGLFERPESAMKYSIFEFASNRLDICSLPDNYVVPDDFTTWSCKVSGQTPLECECSDKWPLTCTNNAAIIGTCPPSAPLDPIPIAPFSAPPPSAPSPIPSSSPSSSPPSSSPSHSGATPSLTSHASSNFSSSPFGFALSVLIASFLL